MKQFVNSHFFLIALTLLFMVGLGTTPAISGEEKEMGKDKGAFMGVYPSELEDSDVEALNFSGKGVMIEGVVDDGPSEEAGVKAGDILTTIGKDKLGSLSDMRSSLAEYKPGDKVNVTVFRKGKEHEFKIVLGEKPKRDILANTYSWSTESKGAFLGIEMIQLDDQLADYFDVKKGVLIKKVVEDSPADNAKLKAGDVITKIGDHKIKSTEDVSKAMAKHDPDEKVEIEVIRKGKKKSFDAVLSKATRKQINILPGMPSLPDPIYFYDNEELESVSEAIKEAMEGIKLEYFDAESSKELQEEMEKLRMEMESLKRDMEKVRQEKEESKK